MALITSITWPISRASTANCWIAEADSRMFSAIPSTWAMERDMPSRMSLALLPTCSSWFAVSVALLAIS
ncbi:hypothetical protein [Marinobacter sp.]|uniref:hypothetical protein n=1 Tax=Marinobacter sp. TaxID=50741 RepID=UPI0025B8D754|nr:hypothetical protein [Marinobacter sp.]